MTSNILIVLYHTMGLDLCTARNKWQLVFFIYNSLLVKFQTNSLLIYVKDCALFKGNEQQAPSNESITLPLEILKLYYLRYFMILDFLKLLLSVSSSFSWCPLLCSCVLFLLFIVSIVSCSEVFSF